MDKTLITLGNRLKCIFLHSKGLPTVSVQMWFRAGSALEKTHDFGIAHFLEHMFFKGTSKRPGPNLVHEIESLGGEINAFTSFDYTCYYINAPKTHLKRSIDILLDMVSNPVFKEDELIPERGVVFEELRRSIDSPQQFAFSRIQKACFTGGYAHPILGCEKTIKTFSKRQLEGFRSRFYNAQNAFLVVAGDLGKKENLIKAIEPFRLPCGQTARFPKFKLKDKAALDIHKKKTAMATLTLAIEAPDFDHRDAAAEDLGINCLGHGESSPLHRRLVVDSSLANSVSASTMFLRKGGVHFIKTSFPAPLIDDVLKASASVLLDCLDGGFSDRDVTKIKNQYIASKTYNLESLESYALSVGHGYAQTGSPEGEDEFIERIKALRSGPVNACFRNIFQKPIHLNLQIPPSACESKSKRALTSFKKSLGQKLRTRKRPPRNYRSVKSKYDPSLKSASLKNGIHLLYRHNPLSPTFALQTYIRGGLSDENPARGGIYGLLSSMLSKGYEGMGYEELKLDLEYTSASLSGFSGKNSYGTFVHGLSRDFPKLAAHAFGSLFSPSFDPKIFRMERELVLRRIDKAKEDPVKICFQRVARLFFGDHPYSLAHTGTKASVRSLKISDLAKLHSQNRDKKELLFTYCGDMDMRELIRQLEEPLEGLRPRKAQKRRKVPSKHTAGVSLCRLDREQSQIFTGIRTGAIGHPDEPHFSLLTAHLSGQSSRLFLEVRDRLGLCYAVQPIHFRALEGGYWGIYMASGHDKVDRAFEAIENILSDIRRNGITKREFNSLKTMIEGQNLINIQTNEDYANTHSPSVLYGYGIDHFFDKNRAINKTTYASFCEAVSKILGKKRSHVVVGRHPPKGL